MSILFDRGMNDDRKVTRYIRDKEEQRKAKESNIFEREKEFNPLSSSQIINVQTLSN